MKISKISRDASLEISRIVFRKFLSKAYSQSCLANFFFLTLKTIFFFFQKFLVPVQPVRQHSIDHRSFVGDIAAPSCERRRAYTSLISEGHTAHCRRNKAFRTVALLYWSDFLSLSLFLCFFCSPFFLIKLHTPVSCRWTRKKKRRGKNETRGVIHHHHHPHSSGIYTELSCKSFHL